MVSKAAGPQLELFFDNLLLLGLLLRNTDIEINIIDTRSGDQRFLAIFGIDSSNFNVSKKVYVWMETYLFFAIFEIWKSVICCILVFLKVALVNGLVPLFGLLEFGR